MLSDSLQVRIVKQLVVSIYVRVISSYRHYRGTEMVAFIVPVREAGGASEGGVRLSLS